MVMPDVFDAAKTRELPHAVDHTTVGASSCCHIAPVHPLQLREQLKHEDLVHLYGIARNWAYSVTTRVDIDRESSTVNEERNGKTPANAPASEEVPAGSTCAVRGSPPTTW